MAKIQIKSEKLTPFGGIFSIMEKFDSMLSPVIGLSSYLVWVGVKLSNAKEEELLINDASQISSKKFDFSIE